MRPRRTDRRVERRDTLLHRMWQNRHFYLFISPFFILFAFLGLYPLGFSLYLSFVKWDGLTPATVIGVENFITLFQDDEFYASLLNTVIIGAMYIPPMFILAFLFAQILNSERLPLRGVFRTSVFLPCITPMVVIAIVFSLLYSSEAGLFNFVMKSWNAILDGGRIEPATWVRESGLVNSLVNVWNAMLPWGRIEPIPWLESEQWSKISVSILLVWRWTGYNMVLMLAGLQGIPGQLYEAATIDGAGRWRQMWHITLPLMRPTFVFCGIMSLIGTFYMFDEVFVLTQGGPGTSSTNFGLFLFNQAFTDFRFGYASAAAYTVAAGVFLTSLVILKWRKPATD